jgi:hypothetical protein
MVRIQKRLSNKRGDKEYFKYVITIPPEEFEKSGFKVGKDLNIKTSKGKIIISK